MVVFRAATIVPAPVEPVFELFTHFHRYPDFLRHVKDVAYYDDQNCRWTVECGGRREFDATNEGWRDSERIGWRGIAGARHAGEARFEVAGPQSTFVAVRLEYDFAAAPAMERDLQFDLDRFARAVGAAAEAGLRIDWNAIPRLTRRVERGEIAAQAEDQRILR